MALKCDLREKHSDDDDEGDDSGNRKERETIDYKQGLEVARRIQALRYLGMLHDVRYWALKVVADLDTRVFCQAKPRRQRGFHRSRTSGLVSQRGEQRRWWQ